MNHKLTVSLQYADFPHQCEELLLFFFKESVWYNIITDSLKRHTARKKQSWLVLMFYIHVTSFIVVVCNFTSFSSNLRINNCQTTTIEPVCHEGRGKKNPITLDYSNIGCFIIRLSEIDRFSNI